MSGTTLLSLVERPAASMLARPLLTGAGLAGLGLVEGLLATFHFPDAATALCALVFGGLTALLVVGGAATGVAGHQAKGQRQVADSRPTDLVATGRVSPRRILLLGLLLSLLLAYGVLLAFPSSADEFGYTYLADTLRHGRLWNPPLPAGLGDVMWTFYIPEKLGRRFSQYPPGWPAILALFPSARLSALANPLLGLASGGLLVVALRALRTPAPLTLCLMLIALLAPFTLFNNASFFNHTSMGTCLIAVAALDLREARRPSPWNHVGIGFAFSVLLTIRYEAFAIALLAYGVDGLLRQRLGVLRGCLFALLGALPVMALFGLYNWRVTGSPLETTLSWAAPQMSYGLHGYGIEGRNTPSREAAHTVRYALKWADFASCAILPFYAAALWGRVRTGHLRWFDLVPPLVVLFFVFYPDGGGFQYGPRYWYAGWILMPLTIAAWFAERPLAAPGGRRVDPLRLGLLQAAAYGGFLVGYGLFAWLQATTREAPLLLADQAPRPALVLFRSQPVRYVPWQVRPLPLASQDYTRNGIDADGPLLLGRDLGPLRTGQVCRMLAGRRKIWRVELGGTSSLQRVC